MSGKDYVAGLDRAVQLWREVQYARLKRKMWDRRMKELYRDIHVALGREDEDLDLDRIGKDFSEVLK